jgi:Ca2+-binding RTX toxin-like protein
VTHLNVWRTVVLLAVPAALTAAIATSAATATTSPYTPHPTGAKFKTPKLHDGVLTIKGTNAGEKIALRLQAGNPDRLQIDVRDDSTADFSVVRSKVTKIVVNARGGDDTVRIDESNGLFTDTIPTTIDGGNGNDTIAGGKGIETLIGGCGDDTIDGNGGDDRSALGDGNDTFIPGTGVTP